MILYTADNLELICLMDILKFIVVSLTSPIVLCFALCALGLLFGLAGLKAVRRTLMSLSVLWILLCSQPYVSDLMLYPLEHKFPQPSLTTQTDYIHVLGCYYDTDGDMSEISRWSECSLQRYIEAFRIYQNTNTKIIVSGGYFLKDKEINYAERAAELLYSLGVPSSHVVVIPEGTTTSEEIALVLARFSDATLGAVSSATHLTRLKMMYRNHSSPVVLFPVDFHSSGDLTWSIKLPSIIALNGVQRALYEFFAIVKYKFFTEQES